MSTFPGDMLGQQAEHCAWSMSRGQVDRDPSPHAHVRREHDEGIQKSRERLLV